MSDLSVFYFFNSFLFRSQALDSLTIFFAVFLIEWMVAAVATLVALAYLPRYRHLLKKNFFVAVSALGAAFIARYALTELIRFFHSRPRPFEVLTDAHQLLFREGGGSFPSGHAAFSFAIAAVVGRYYPKTGIVFYAVAILISISRVVAGVHWPSDILGGTIIGIGVGFLVHAISKKFKC